MKTNKKVIRVKVLYTFLSFAILCVSFTHSEKKSVYSIEELIRDGKIEVSINGVGGHSGNCVQFNVKNNSSELQDIYLAAGRRFVSEDPTIQDIVLTRSEELELAAGEYDSFLCYGFCCQSSNASPKKNSKFEIGRMVPRKWSKLIFHLEKEYYPESTVQSAIWTLSNNHLISSIYDKEMHKTLKLRRIISEIKNEPVPWYTVEYKKDTSRVFSNRATKVQGIIDFEIETGTLVSFIVKDKKGKIIKVLSKDKEMGTGFYKNKIWFTTENWSPGDYRLIVCEENLKRNKEFSFTI